MPRVKIPVVELEFDEGGNTIWVHGLGGTVLRVKTMQRIETSVCQPFAPSSHTDVLTHDIIHVCLIPKDQPEKLLRKGAPCQRKSKK